MKTTSRTRGRFRRRRRKGTLLGEWVGLLDSPVLFASARRLYLEQRYDDAAPLFRYLLAFRTQAPTVWSWLGACFEAQGDRRAALRVYRGALEALCPLTSVVVSSEQRERQRAQREKFAARIRALRRLRYSRVSMPSTAPFAPGSEVCP